MIQEKIHDLLLDHYRRHDALPSHVHVSFQDMLAMLSEMNVPIDFPMDTVPRVSMQTGYGSVPIYADQAVPQYMVRIVEYHDFRKALKEN